MISLASIALLLASVRPPCKADNVGEMWPAAARSNSELMMQLAKQGSLRICSRGLWKYQWQSPTVTLDQLRDSHEGQKGKFHLPSLTNR
jgi:hypothetical protein